jgi:hypothetical protein
MLVSVSRWITTNFDAESAPTPQTVCQWLRAGELEGVKIGGLWYLKSLEALDCIADEPELESEVAKKLDFSFMTEG